MSHPLCCTREFLSYYFDLTLLPEHAQAALAELDEFIENLRGDLYLWRIGEIDAEKAMSVIRDALESSS